MGKKDQIQENSLLNSSEIFTEGPSPDSPASKFATTALEKAIKLNSFLRNEYEPLLKEAKALSL